MKKKNSIMGMAFFGPALVLLTIFLFLPMLLTFGFSFTDYFALNPELTHFVGLEIYINIFKDDLFVQSFINTVKFVIIIVPLQCGGALLLALAINKAAHCKKYFKVAFFVPVVMSLAVVSTLWMQIYSPEGILNTLLANFGINAQPFIHSADQALPSIAIMSVWQGVGYQMIIFLGGLQNINPALYEAAEMDHASAWQKFKDITLPELKPLPPRICGSLSTIAKPATPFNARSKVVTLFLLIVCKPTTSIVCMEAFPSRFSRVPCTLTVSNVLTKVSIPTFRILTSSPGAKATSTSLSA